MKNLFVLFWSNMAEYVSRNISEVLIRQNHV